MSNLLKGNADLILNPMARTVLTLKVSDQGQTELKSELPPKDVLKVLNSVGVEVLMNYCEAFLEHKLGASIQKP